jgi:hypothetical protein
MTVFPKTLELEWTTEKALSEIDEYDEDAENEDSISALQIEIGQSREEFDLESWDDIPEGYIPTNEKYAEEYKEYLANKGFD